MASRTLTLWLFGLYRSVWSMEYGGAVRSRGLYSILRGYLGDVIVVAYSKHEGEEVGGGVLTLKLGLARRVAYSILEALVRLGVVSRRSHLRASVLGPSSASLRSLREAARGYERVNVVVDGFPGLVLFNRLKGRLEYDKVVYVSHNFEADYRTGGGRVRALEASMLEEADLVIAASVRDALRYRELGGPEGRLVVFPNVFPVEYTPEPRSDKLLIAVVAGSSAAWAARAACFLSRRGVDVLYVGRERPPCRVQWTGFIEDRSRYLSTLSRAHAGLNYDVHLGGSNVKRYDYALAGLAVLSGGTGMRGEPLPGELAFADLYDLAAKLSAYTTEELAEMGRENKEHATRMYREALKALREALERVLAWPEPPRQGGASGGRGRTP